MKIYAEVVCYQLSFGQVSDNRSVFIKQYKRMILQAIKREPRDFEGLVVK